MTLSAITQTDELTVENLKAIASARAGLTDFGPNQYEEALETLTRSMREEAQLSEQGLMMQSERLLNSLNNRLRKQALLTKHPEILDERIKVSAIIIGLPRTGSTMFQRLLASHSNFTATYWWETMFPMPLDHEPAGDPSERIAMGEALMEQILGAMQNFEAIHPMDARAHDEEVMMLEHSFVSNVPASAMYVPTYDEWMLSKDQTDSLRELIDYIKILQWQTPERRQQGWILKSPHHLTCTATLLKLFPDALIVMPHRPIDEVMPSWYSMVGTLTKADCNIDDVIVRQAHHWNDRLARNLQDTIAARRSAPERFIDIHYQDLLSRPLEACKSVFQRLGLPFGDDDIEQFKAHMAANKRDDRPPHKHNLADYDITLDRIREIFAFYSEEFAQVFER